MTTRYTADGAGIAFTSATSKGFRFHDCQHSQTVPADGSRELRKPTATHYGRLGTRYTVGTSLKACVTAKMPYLDEVPKSSVLAGRNYLFEQSLY